jgi:hypothetical protein
MSSRPQLHGTRLALVGFLLYLCEWIGIALAPSLPTDKLGHDPAKIVAAYADKPGWTAFLAGWLSVVLLGRVLFVAAFRESLRDVPKTRILTAWALGAMIMSVVIEVTDYALVATGAWIAHAGGATGAIVALDAAGTMLFAMLFGPIAISVFAGSAAMLVSRLFPRWIGWLGLVSGALLAVGAMIGASALGSSGGYNSLGGALTNLPLAGALIWMAATAAVLFMRARRPTPSAGT